MEVILDYLGEFSVTQGPQEREAGGSESEETPWWKKRSERFKNAALQVCRERKGPQEIPVASTNGKRQANKWIRLQKKISPIIP